jgi:hypothetical protein
VKLPVPVYGPVPPADVTVTVADPPLQDILVEVEPAVNTVGSVTVMLVVAVHPFASVTVYECVPALTVKLPVPVYGPVPPADVTVTVAVPPLQEMLVAVEPAVSKVGSVKVMLVVAVHPLASVAVYEYVPAITLNEPVPVYGAVPPFPATTTVVEPPLHKIPAVFELAVRVVG